MNPTSVFWIDDELDTTIRFLRLDLELRGFRITPAASVLECVERLKGFGPGKPAPDAIILDAIMSVPPTDRKTLAAEPGASGDVLSDAYRAGLWLLEKISRVLSAVPIIILTNLSENTETGASVLEDMQRYPQVKKVLFKPQRAEDLASAVVEVAGTRGD